MCGIAGFVGLRIDNERRAVTEMCERIRHRGPDGGGVTVHEGVALGMVRLAIVDVTHGHQPMVNEDGSVAIVYNGEVYNAPALRRSLEAEGVTFRTRSDTEVILRLYERDPEDVEARLRGMWAFAIHDRRHRRLVLSRDRFGIKPLFVADTGRGLAFGSELRAFRPLQSALGDALHVDSGAAHAMLAWSYVPNEDTIFSGVKRLGPATRLEVDLASGARRRSRFYAPRPSREAMRVQTLDDACALVAPLLAEAVHEHLESDVPVAAFLSGGIDSSLVLANAVQGSPRPLEAFSIGFRELRFDESRYAEAVARELGVRHQVEILDEATVLAALDDALRAYDEPFGDPSSLPTFILSRLVARTHKVALGGDGGDEVFAGYKKHQVIRMREAVRRVPRLAELASTALMALPARTDASTPFTDALRVARRLARSIVGSDSAAYLALTQVATLERTGALVEHPAEAERFVEPILRTFASAGGTALQRTLVGDLENVLPNDMLTKVDRASMACHLEARVPLLDHRLVEVGLGLPAHLTLRPKGKRVLRELFARRFGRELADRKKTGFDVPVDRWLKTSLDERSRDVVKRLGAGGVLRVTPARLDDLKRHDAQLAWHVFAFAAWASALEDP